MLKSIGLRDLLATAFAIGLLVVPFSGAQAQLEWAATELIQEQPADATVVTATFTCQNSGDYPLYVRRVAAQGAGARAWLQGGGKTIRPGEARSVKLTRPNRLLFDEETLSVEVVTDAREGAVTKLELEVTPRGWSGMDAAARTDLKAQREVISEIPMPIEFDRRTMIWLHDSDEAPSGSREINIRFADGHAAEVLELQPSGGNPDEFATRLEVVEAGRHYRVVVTPEANNPVQGPDPPAVQARRPVIAYWRVMTSLRGRAGQRAVLEGPLMIQAMTRPESIDLRMQPAGATGVPGSR